MFAKIKIITGLLFLTLISLPYQEVYAGADTSSKSEEKSDQEQGTYLNLSVTETKETYQDLLVANLRYEAESGSSREVQGKINQAMEKAVDAGMKHKSLQISTDRYYVYKFYQQTKKGDTPKEMWKGSQGIVIKSKDTDKLLEFTGQLQDMGFAINGMHYEVSLETAEEIKNSLIDDAINKMLSKAKRVGDIIGKKELTIKNININGDNYYVATGGALRHAEMSADKISAATISDPISLPGKQTISLTVFGTVLFK